MTTLEQASMSELLDWLDASCAWLWDHREEAFVDSRLSREGFELAVSEALPSLRDLKEALNWMANVGAKPMGNLALVLPNNVETAILRPLFWSLLARNKTRVKIPSGSAGGELPSLGSGFARLTFSALTHTNASLAASVTAHRFDRHDLEALDALIVNVDAVHVFGRDETVEAIRRLAPEGHVVPHGSGLGVMLLHASRRADFDVVARRIARDIARHDQRGCLSPHALLIEDGNAEDAEVLATAMHHALCSLDVELPRGLLSPHEAQSERAWRDVALATGELESSKAHSVSIETSWPPRDCPGLRNIAIHVGHAGRIDALMYSLGTHLKCLGILDQEALRAARIRFAQASEVVVAGEMQTPRFNARMDGVPAHHGFVRV